MPQCEITGIVASHSLWGCHNHHYIKQQQWKKNHKDHAPYFLSFLGLVRGESN